MLVVALPRGQGESLYSVLPSGVRQRNTSAWAQPGGDGEEEQKHTHSTRLTGAGGAENGAPNELASTAVHYSAVPVEYL